MCAKRLRAEHITKRYESVCARQDTCFSLNAGESHALMGENEPGKSTLSNILAGAAPDHGSLRVVQQFPATHWVGIEICFVE